MDQPFPSSNNQFPAAGGKYDPVTRIPFVLEKYMGAGQGSMPAQIDFDSGCKPADMKPPAVPHIKSSLGQIILRRYGLQQCVFRPTLQRADRGRVSGEKLPAKSIDLV